MTTIFTDHFFTSLFIFLGAILMGVSIFFARRLLIVLNESKYKRFWQLLVVFMIVFFLGYASAFFLSILEKPEILAMLTGVIFFFGALFVFIVVRLGSDTISDLFQTSVSKTYIENLLDTIPDVLVVLTPETTIRRINKAALSVTGYKPYELIGKEIKRVFPDLNISANDCVGRNSVLEVNLVTKNGEQIPVTLSITSYCDGNRKPVDFIIVAKDITTHKNTEERLEYAASHDSLTGLPNRAFLYELLKEAIQENLKNSINGFGIIFLDLDHFKEINDDHGHLIGDQMLNSVARRLEECVRKDDFVCRLGGDEFVILLKQEPTKSNIKILSRRIIKEMNLPFELVGKKITISSSIGYLYCQSGYTNPSDVLRDADIALYSAKTAGRNCCREFDPTLRSL